MRYLTVTAITAALIFSSCNQKGFSPSETTIPPTYLFGPDLIDDLKAGIDFTGNFNGTSNFYQTNINLAAANFFSVTAWIQPNSTNQVRHIFWQGLATGNGFGNMIASPEQEMSLTIGNVCDLTQPGPCPAAQTANVTPNVISFHMGDTQAGENPGVLNISVPFIETSRPTMITVVVEDLSSSPRATMYMNGQRVGSDTGSTARLQRNNWNTNLRLAGPGASSRFLNGQLFQILTHLRILTEKDVKSLCWYKKAEFDTACVK